MHDRHQAGVDIERVHVRERIAVAGQLDEHVLGIVDLPVEHAVLELRAALVAVLHQHPRLRLAGHVDRHQARNRVRLAAIELGAREAAQQPVFVLERAVGDLEGVDGGRHEARALLFTRSSATSTRWSCDARDEGDFGAVGRKRGETEIGIGREVRDGWSRRPAPTDAYSNDEAGKRAWRIDLRCS